MLFQGIRFFTVLFSILIYLIHLSCVFLIVWDRWERAKWASRILCYYSSWGLWLLKVKVNLQGYENVKTAPASLMVGNHLSYMDILVITSKVPASFVTSTEIRDTIGLGLICKMSGCLFVDRKSKLNIHNEVKEITEGLRRGLNVAIFPESTSTNGEQILRFRRPLYVGAIDAGSPVVPFCLNYRKVGGEPVSIRNRDSVFWYGDMNFIPHLWKIAGCGGVEVDLHYLTPIRTQFEDDPTELAANSQRLVESVFIAVRPEL